MPDQLAEKLEPSDDSSGPSYIDYSERRSLPISIPDYHYVENTGEKHVVSLQHKYGNLSPYQGLKCSAFWPSFFFIFQPF